METQVIQPPATSVAGISTTPTHPLKFHGTGGTLFGIHLKNILLALVTLGIYHFWGKVHVRRFFYSQTEFGGDRFVFHGTGKEFLIGALKALALFIPVLAAMVIFVPEIFYQLYIFGAFIALYPLIAFGSRRFRMRRTSWRGVHFSFRGTLAECYTTFLLGSVLTVITFGIYYPRFRVKMQRYWVNNTYFGNIPFRYHGEEAVLAKILLRYYLILLGMFGLFIAMTSSMTWLPKLGIDPFGLLLSSPILLAPIIIAVFVIYVMCIYKTMAAQQKYHWEQTQFMSLRFHNTITARKLFNLYFGQQLIIMFTLGIAYTWVQVYKMNFTFENLIPYGDMDVTKILQEAQAASSTGTITEALGDAFDVEIELA